MSDDMLLKLAREKFIEDFNSREPLSMGVADGIVWTTVVGPPHLPWLHSRRPNDVAMPVVSTGINGYAMIPAEGHPWSAELPCYDEWGLDEILDVHGGVTYARHPWIGFDTAHAWDLWPPEYDRLGITSRYVNQEHCIRWTPEMVAAKAKNLAIQVAKIGQEAEQAQLDIAKCNTLTEEGERA